MLPGGVLEQSERRTGSVLALLSVLIFSVPLLSDEANTAWKLGFAGFAIFAGVLTWLWATRRSRRRKRLLQKPAPRTWEGILKSRVAYYHTLKPKEQNRFMDMVRVFLDEIPVTGVKTEIDDDVRLLVAASAIIPVFGYPDWEFYNLGEVLILPGSVEQYVDDATGRKSHALGQVKVINSDSIMLLSRKSLEQGFRDMRDKQNVGIHEFAHILDHADGEIDGIPDRIMPKNLIRPWSELMSAEIKKIRQGRSKLRAYAGTNEAEFFAVTTEYFFEQPRWLEKHFPEVYRILRRVYRQHTSSTFVGDLNRMIRPHGRKVGRNDPCPCGSGKKFKRCCGKGR